MDNDTDSIGSQDIPKVKEKFIYGTGCLFELTKWLVVVIVLILMVNFFVLTISVVDGLSMEPSFHTGEVVIVNRWQYLFGEPQRGDPITLKFPGDPDHKKYIKRLIGLPGDAVNINNGFVYINGTKLIEPYLQANTKTYPAVNRTLGPDEYFLLGDNRDNSSDSRIWGVAPKRDLIGRASYIIWPINYFGKIPEYGKPTLKK